MTALPGPSTTESPGRVLCAAREAAGLSVADVAVQLRLSTRQVQALEAERYHELPGAVFVRGFIRNYARVLKMDPIPLLFALEPALGREAPLRMSATTVSIPVAARRNHSTWTFVAFGLVVAALVAAGAYELLDRNREQSQTLSRPSPEREAAVNRQSASTAAADSAPAIVTLTPASPPEEPAVPTDSNSAPAGAAQAPGSEERPHVAAETRPTASQAHIARVGIRFTGPSWVEVRDRGGNVVFSGTGHPTSERTIEGQPPLSIVIGNAAGVAITYNERPLDVASLAARNIARFTLE